MATPNKKVFAFFHNKTVQNRINFEEQKIITFQVFFHCLVFFILYTN
jgi:hypothetical protein